MNSFDPFDLREQEQRQEKLADLSQAEKLAEADDLKWVMSNKRGRRFVARLLDRAGVWRSSFSTNALSMAFSEGQRNEGLRLLADITTRCPDRYQEMLQESGKDE